MNKKRIIAGILSLLLIITSVFTGNVVTARAENNTEINEDTTINSTTSYDQLVVNAGKKLTISGPTGEGEPIVVTIGNKLTVGENGSVVASGNAVLEISRGAMVSGIDLYNEEGSLLSSGGIFTNNSGDFMAFDWDEANSRWVLHVESWDPSYDDFNPDKNQGLYMIKLKNCNATCGSVSFGTMPEASKVNPEDASVSKNRFNGSVVSISFTPIEGEYVDRIQIGETEYRPGDEDFQQPENMEIEGEVFTYTTKETDFDEYGYLYIEVDFIGGGNGANCYGKDGRLEFRIENPDKGDVFFQIGTGTKYRVGGTGEVSEETIQNELKDTTLEANNTIIVWAEKFGGKIVGNFDIRIEGTSVFASDDARTEARTKAESPDGCTFTVPAEYVNTQRIEFQIEFRDETPGGGGGEIDVTYTENTTISEDTIKNDITVSGGTLTINNCSVRVDHKLVVESGANIVGTSGSSKLVFAGGAFSNGKELYYGNEKISDDNNNYFLNNGDGPIEFIWNTTTSKWVTEQQPAEGGGEAPWYTVSYGNSANLTTKNGKVYAERVHIGDTTYSSIASEYNESDTDKIYSMKDTIFHQKTEEEENDPNYKDSLTKYGIGGSDGDIFIRNDVSGVSIDFKFIPDFGYQLTNIYTNENETDSLLNDFTAAEAVSSFKFNVIQGKNVHFEVKFEKVDNKVTGNANITSTAKIESTNAAASGTLNMKVDNATAIKDIPSGSEALAAYDITLTNEVSKGGNRGSWDTKLENLGTNVATVTLPVDDTTNYTYSVIREHTGENPVTLDATVKNGAISFDTNKFSTYTIVRKRVNSGGGSNNTGNSDNNTGQNSGTDNGNAGNVPQKPNDSNKVVIESKNEIATTVSGAVLKSDMKIQQKEVAKTSDTYKDAINAIEKKGVKALKEAEYIKVYEIDLLQGNVEIHEVGGTVQVSFNAPSDLKVAKDERVVIYRLNDDGSLTKCNTKFENGKIVFETDHFSTYILAKEKVNTAATNTLKTATKTGDNNKIALWLYVLLAGCFMIVTAAICGVKIFRRR